MSEKAEPGITVTDLGIVVTLSNAYIKQQFKEDSCGVVKIKDMEVFRHATAKRMGLEAEQPDTPLGLMMECINYDLREDRDLVEKVRIRRRK